MEDSTRTEAEGDLISLERCRELLEDEAEGLSDDDIDRVRRHAASLAQVLIEMALERERQD